MSKSRLESNIGVHDVTRKKKGRKMKKIIFSSYIGTREIICVHHTLSQSTYII